MRNTHDMYCKILVINTLAYTHSRGDWCEWLHVCSNSISRSHTGGPSKLIDVYNGIREK